MSARFDIGNTISALQTKVTNLECPMCKQNDWTVEDNGFANLSISQDAGVTVIGGHTIPAVIMACRYCGFMAQHSAIVLGLV